jgi:hypothetical protein
MRHHFLHHEIHMAKRRFMMIGSSDFDLYPQLLRNGWHGTYVEPNKDLINLIPSRISKHLAITDYSVRSWDGCANLINKAVSSYNGTITMVGPTLEFMEEQDQAGERWVRGVTQVAKGQTLGNFYLAQPYFEGKLREFQAECVTLDTLLRPYASIGELPEVLIVDTEGHELDIFRSYSFFHRPKFIKCEYKHLDMERQEELIAIFRKHDYLVEQGPEDLFCYYFG